MQVVILKDEQGLPVTCAMAKLYKRNKLVGYCLDTPNAIACVIGNGFATKAFNTFGELVKLEKNRIKNNGWLSIDKCKFIRV